MLKHARLLFAKRTQHMTNNYFAKRYQRNKRERASCSLAPGLVGVVVDQTQA